MKRPIDFVLLWVDDSDPDWLEQRASYQNTEQGVSMRAMNCRYREWGTLKYWFRAVERYAPWVRRIHLVTNGQIPAFLETEHPKIDLVCHADYMEKAWLPTFNSMAIEINVHRIRDLAEQFVLFNDDMFFNAPVREEYFFRDGKPCYRMIDRPEREQIRCNTHEHARHNGMLAIGRHFDKSELERGKLIHPCYGAANIGSIWNVLTQRRFGQFRDSQLPTPMLRSTLAEIWEREPELMAATSSCRFRDRMCVNQYIVRYWDMARGNFVPCRERGRAYDVCKSNVKRCIRDIERGKEPLLTVNDSEAMDDYEFCRRSVIEAFERRYPSMSSFEKR